MPADLIIYAFIAIGLVFWLRNTLGTHEEGDEPINARPPLPDINEDMTTSPAAATLVEAPKQPQNQIDDIKQDKGGIIGIEGRQAEIGLEAIMNADKSFDLKFFFSAVQDVFVMVVEAFAEGKRDELADMLGDEVFAAFDAAISAREDAGHVMSSEVQSISQAHIIDAALEGKTAFITLRFIADQITVTKDEDGAVIEGNPTRSSHMKDIWAFSRDIKSRDPRWFVVETRGDFEGDNDIIPNA